MTKRQYFYVTLVCVMIAITSSIISSYIIYNRAERLVDDAIEKTRKIGFIALEEARRAIEEAHKTSKHIDFISFTEGYKSAIGQPRDLLHGKYNVLYIDCDQMIAVVQPAETNDENTSLTDAEEPFFVMINERCTKTCANHSMDVTKDEEGFCYFR